MTVEDLIVQMITDVVTNPDTARELARDGAQALAQSDDVGWQRFQGELRRHRQVAEATA